MLLELMMARGLMRGRGHDPLDDVDGDQRDAQDAGMLAALLDMERNQTMQRALDGISRLLQEQNDLLKGMADRNQAVQGGGLSSSMALEAFKTLDNDRDGNVTRDELDRHLGLGGQIAAPTQPGASATS